MVGTGAMPWDREKGLGWWVEAHVLVVVGSVVCVGGIVSIGRCGGGADCGGGWLLGLPVSVVSLLLWMAWFLLISLLVSLSF